MEAGVLTYRLCDHNMDCEHCPLDKALQSPAEPSITVQAATSAEHDLLRHLRQTSFSPAAYYGRAFWYAELLPPTRVRLGLNELAAKLLPTVAEVMLPCRNSHVQPTQTLCWFATPEGTLTLDSPLSGLVVDVNQHLVEDIERQRQGQSGQVWLLTMEVLDYSAILNEWSSGQRAVQYLKAQQDQVLLQLSECVHTSHPDLGPTLNDGGELIGDIATAMGSTHYLQWVQTQLNTSSH
jgi:glycine cleavage system H lipoate-binding protein